MLAPSLGGCSVPEPSGPGIHQTWAQVRGFLPVAERAGPTFPPPPSRRGAYQHVEGAVGDVLASEADGDDVFARLGRRVVNVKGPVVVLVNYSFINLPEEIASPTKPNRLETQLKKCGFFQS